MQVWSGTVYYEKQGRVLKPGVNANGYYSVMLCKDRIQTSFDVHRLVAIAFLEKDINRECVNHKDYNKLNNHFSNLEWVTKRENNVHRHLNEGRKTSKYVGVFKWKHSKKEKYAAACQVNGEDFRRYFDTEEEAHQGYLKLAQENNITNKYAN